MDDSSEMTRRVRAAGLKKLNDVVDEFARAMKSKLNHKAIQGSHGWDDPSENDQILARLVRQVSRLDRDGSPQEIDIANLAMMLWFQRERGTSDSVRSEGGPGSG